MTQIMNLQSSSKTAGIHVNLYQAAAQDFDAELLEVITGWIDLPNAAKAEFWQVPEHPNLALAKSIQVLEPCSEW